MKIHAMSWCPFCNSVWDESEYSHCPYCDSRMAPVKIVPAFRAAR